MKVFNIFWILPFLFFGTTTAQEIVTGVPINQTVALHYQKTIEHIKPSGCNCNQTTDQALPLPFFDDFSTSKVVPDATKWRDKNVFINDNFASFPLNKGVATFDALDSTGRIYKNADYIAFPADVLTSAPIRTDSIFSPVARKLSPADSLYFSFYYQPQGLGNEPETWDTLLLEFAYFTGDTIFSHVDSIWVSANTYLENQQDTIRPFDTLWAPPGCNPNMFKINYQTLTWDDWIQMPCDSVMVPEKKWKEVWSSMGMKLDTFRLKYGADFARVMIPLTDTLFFQNGFQFRFRNYASIANDIIPNWKSNADEWNIDLVYLNYNRSISDTTFRRITFSERAPSFLKRYEVMPYRQYRSDPINTLAENVHLYISNLDKIEHNTKYRYEVYGSDGTLYYSYDGGSCNLPPVYSYGFQNCNSSCGAAHACPPVNSSFYVDYNIDTASFVIKHYISDSSQNNILVDSVVYRQGFYNYFAYDDGTPELGYSLEPSGAKLAYKFKLNLADTLQGVQIYFNPIQNNNNPGYFKLMVWSDNNGQPGEVLYEEEGHKVEYSNGLYSFYPYLFENPLLVSGTFYVGFEQEQAGGLNIGFDANHDRRENIFYNVENTWYQSNYAGALLIRPIVGNRMVLYNRETKTNNIKLTVYPNPTHNKLYFDLKQKQRQNTAIEVYSLVGRKIMALNTRENYIDVSRLPQGIYLLRMQTANRFYWAKFQKQ